MSEAPLFTDLIGAAIERHPDKPAVISNAGMFNFVDLERLRNRLLKALSAEGFSPGDRVALAAGTKVEFIANSIALMANGAVVAQVRPAPEEEMLSWLQRIEPRFLVHDGHALPTAISAGPWKAISTEDLEPVFYNEPGPSIDAADMAMIMPTSGTQGPPKGVVLTHGNLAAVLHQVNDFMGVDGDIVEYLASPPGHAFGFVRVRCVLGAGGTLVVDEGPFNPLRLLTALAAHDCNSIGSVASAFELLMDKMTSRFTAHASRMRWMDMGSVPLRPATADALCDAFPDARVVMEYGMTEAPHTTLVDFAGETGRGDTVGRAAPCNGIRVVGDDGAPLADNEAGHVEVRGPQVAAGYWRDDAAWQARVQDGWFRSDDMGRLDGDGYLHFVGRADDIINCGGEKVSPVAIEDRIQPLLDGIEMCVCGAEDSRGLLGEVPVLCFEGQWPDGFEWNQLRVAFSRALPAAHVPRHAVVLDSFPRTSNGKLRRRTLRDQVEAGGVERVVAK